MRPLIYAVPALVVACATASTVSPGVHSMPEPAQPAALGVAVPIVEDPYLWLEEVSDDASLRWVTAQNDRTFGVLANDEQRALKQRLLAIYDSQDKIPYAFKRGAHLYNFWQDREHVRGLWRRTSLEQYKQKDPRWEVMLDLDALAEAEDENWVWKGVTWLQPSYARALVMLSRGGGDAIVVREFDVGRREFAKDGFVLPEAKSSVYWKDEDTLYVATDFGPGSLTSSGYPRLAKQWRRGQPLTAATTVYEGSTSDVDVMAARDWHQGRNVDLVQRSFSLFDRDVYILGGEAPEKLDKPADVEASLFQDFVLFRTRTPWEVGGATWPPGALLAARLAEYRAGKRELQPIFVPTSRSSLSSHEGTKNLLLLNVLEDVRSKVFAARFERGAWKLSELAGAAAIGNFSAAAYDDAEDDRYWFMASDFLSPARLELGDAHKGGRAQIRSMPEFFRADGLEVKQFFATSRDGTRVPYFQVSKRELALNGDNPTLLYGYGGFEIALTPGYNPAAGAAWLEKGGVYVQANIRGGGEYGPAWHHAALKGARQRSYDDFIAIAEDLIARKVTQPRRLGIQGGSNGGLLMGVMLTQRPELFGAIVCSVPLLDMKRYHKLLAGASWMSEYGDPDKPDEWAVLERYSPYQNVEPGAHYPPVLFTTSMRDDRVHPAHARKMVARMLEQGHDVLYYENIEGGHAGAANNEQRAYVGALEFEFFYQKLMK
jgi:prolyl oligopeptidase